MSIETIRLRLLTILDDEAGTIMPRVRENVLDLRAQLTENMSNVELVVAIRTLTAIGYDAGQYGRDDIAANLEAVENDLRDLRSGPVEPDEPVFYINFHGGTVDGNHIGHTPAEVADSLMSIVSALQLMDETPDHASFKGGAICDN